MTLQKVSDAILVSDRVEGDRLTLTAKLTLSASLSTLQSRAREDLHHREQMTVRAKAMILASLYDDRRREFSRAITDLLIEASPVTPAALAARGRLLALARWGPPEG